LGPDGFHHKGDDGCPDTGTVSQSSADGGDFDAAELDASPVTGADDGAEEARPGPRVSDAVATAAAPPIQPDGGAVLAAERMLMRARLAAMAAPRESDTTSVAQLRAILRDETTMAHVVANVEAWPPLCDEQRELLAALLHRAHPARRRVA
jgi:hypothetical protein